MNLNVGFLLLSRTTYEIKNQVIFGSGKIGILGFSTQDQTSLGACSVVTEA